MSNELGFEVGTPVHDSDVPTERKGKYTELFRKVEALNSGMWLPVTVSNIRMGQRLIEVAKLRGFRRKRRGLVVYITKKEE
jgi:hypothetical protein